MGVRGSAQLSGLVDEVQQAYECSRQFILHAPVECFESLLLTRPLTIPQGSKKRSTTKSRVFLQRFPNESFHFLVIHGMTVIIRQSWTICHEAIQFLGKCLSIQPPIARIHDYHGGNASV